MGYQRYVEDTGRTKQGLPGLKYTPEQLFWIAFGNVWCQHVRPQSLEATVETGTHSPAVFRVLGVVRIPICFQGRSIMHLIRR